MKRKWVRLIFLWLAGAVSGEIFSRLAQAVGLPGWVGYAVLVGGLVILVLVKPTLTYVKGLLRKDGGFENLPG